MGKTCSFFEYPLPDEYIPFRTIYGRLGDMTLKDIAGLPDVRTELNREAERFIEREVRPLDHPRQTKGQHPMNPSTINDLIINETGAATTQTLAAAAAASADADLATANTDLTVSSSALAAGLAAVGQPVYTIDTTQAVPVVTVYVTDTSPAGWHSFVPLPSTTPLPVPPAPTAIVNVPAVTS